MKNENFKISLILSLALHCLLVYFLFFFKFHYATSPEERIIVFDMVDAADVNNIINQTKENPKAIEVPPEEAKKTLETATQPIAQSPYSNEKSIAPQEKPNVEQKPKIDNSSIKEIENELNDIFSPKKTEEKKSNNKNNDKSPSSKTESNKSKDKNRATTELESLLKNLESPSKGEKEKSNKISQQKGKDKVTTTGNSTGSNNLSLTEINLIKKQIEKVWNLPVGATNSRDALITLYIHFDESGDVLEVKLLNANCPNLSTVTCRAIADSAIRAVKNASPIENLRKDRYHIWQKLNIQFDPNDILQ